MKEYYPPFCAVCGENILGYEPFRRPLGRGGAFVRVCISCDTEHPRHGRYAFSERSRGVFGGKRSIKQALS